MNINDQLKKVNRYIEENSMGLSEVKRKIGEEDGPVISDNLRNLTMVNKSLSDKVKHLIIYL